MPENAAAYEHYPVPATSEPIYIIDKDKEQARAIIQVMFKDDPLPEELKNTPMFLAANYMNSVAASILNARLGEISQKPECPFIGAGGQDDNYMISKTMDAFTVGILPKPGKDAEALQAVMEEIERINRFGFTATEIIRAREEFLSGMERIYDNREKQKNSFYVPQYVRHFLEGDPIPDIETEYNTYKMLAPNIPAEAISAVFKEYTASTDTNFVCLAMYPEKEDVAVPTVEQFKNAVAAAKAAQLEAYVDNVKDEPLVPQLPKAVKIKKKTRQTSATLAGHWATAPVYSSRKRIITMLKSSSLQRVSAAKVLFPPRNTSTHPYWKTLSVRPVWATSPQRNSRKSLPANRPA